MLPPQTRFRVNEAEVTGEVFDGEAIILNLATGAYYSIDRTGCLIWTLITGGHSLEETVIAILSRYDVEPERARTDIERVAGDLVREKLVRIEEGHREPGPLPEPTSRDRLPYVPPALNVYRDMAAMLALDPPMPRLDEIPWKESDDRLLALTRAPTRDLARPSASRPPPTWARGRSPPSSTPPWPPQRGRRSRRPSSERREPIPRGPGRRGGGSAAGGSADASPESGWPRTSARPSRIFERRITG